MPARRDRTVEEIREQNRLRKQRQRSRDRSERSRDAAPPSTYARTSRSPELSPTETERKDNHLVDVERIRLTLTPFAARGYVHDSDFWALMAERFPQVDLVVQAYGIARWLTGPKGQGRSCSEAFLRNWITKEAARSPRAVRAAPARKSQLTRILESIRYAAG